MATNGFQQSYSNERPPSSTGSGDAELASDPASSSFFLNDFKKHEDLKQMLDSNKDSLKLEAMKRTIGMVAKGKDASDLFPAVVKNVVSKNIEVKKLVYVYLTRYAEEQQDLALLSISTFQRALKDPNQLIRASALRVLSSIRVPMIVPIMMLAIKESVMDMSPYVRKTAAHAIPKLYSLDAEQKDQLIEVIEKLLADKTTLVAGSAIQAFEEVCPERIDLIHKNYRKLCNLLVDVEEWGQVVIINMLSRYARTQFINPNQEDVMDELNEKAFYDSSEDSEKEETARKQRKPYVMDPDHRLLLRNSKPLLNSRNAAVVMAVAQLYHHCAPKGEVGLVSKALIRLLRGHKEVQYVVLSNIASMSVNRKGMFEPFLKSFYIRSNDPTHVKLLKLEILTNLATETNISTILREFQTYVTSSDKEFAAATIQAIGRCASTISEITDACLNGLVNLLSNRNEAVVGESVVVIKKLLQMQPTEHKDIIMHLAKLVDTITVPMARASILWLIGEYSDRVPKIAPDVLRKMARSFVDEEDIVKLQILNLSAKLCITNSKQTKLLCQYIFNLAKYDQNYDIRDRARFLRQMILPGEKGGPLAKHARKIFLAVKPAPVLESKFKGHDQLQLGTLSHIINLKAQGYQELPDWPEVAPDPSVRNVEVAEPWTEKYRKKPVDTRKKKKSFYSESEESSSEEDTSSEGDTSSDEEEEEEDTSSEGDEEVSSDEEEEESEAESTDSVSSVEPISVPGRPKRKVESSSEEDEEETSSEEESSSEEEEEETSEEEEEVPAEKFKKPQKKEKGSKEAEKSKAPQPSKQMDLLLDLDDFAPSGDPGLTLAPSSVLSPVSAMEGKPSKPKPDYSSAMTPVYTPTVCHELLNRITGHGLAVNYRFTRTVSIFSKQMVSVELLFLNNSDAPLQSIRIGHKKLQKGMQVQDFPDIATLGAGANTSVLMGIDFNDTTQPAQFELCTQTRKFNVSITAPVGELLQPNTLSENDFLSLQGKLTGMNENQGSTALSPEGSTSQAICNAVYEVANVLQVPGTQDNVYRFSSKTAAAAVDALITVKVSDNKASITVNCEKMVIGSMLVKDLKQSLGKA